MKGFYLKVEENDMEFLEFELDYSFPFASGLTAMVWDTPTIRTISGFERLCYTLTEKYQLPVEMVVYHKKEQTIYFKVPEKCSEVQAEWINEILQYNKQIGMLVRLIRSDESKYILQDFLQIRSDIEDSVSKILTVGGGKLAYTDKACKMMKDAISSAIRPYTVEQDHVYDVAVVDDTMYVNVEMQKISKVHAVDVTGVIK